MTMWPSVGSYSRLTIFSSVVLPHPDGPRSTTKRPGSIVNETSSTAGAPPDA